MPATATRPTSTSRTRPYEGLRAVIYARVSRDDKRGRSPDEQIEECRAWMDREGIVESGVVRDDGRSATRHARRKREGYEELTRSWLPRADVDMVVTWSSSRAGRTLDDYTELRRLFVEHDTFWAYSGQVYDLTDRSDRFRTGLDALRSEDEVEAARDALLRAMRKNAAEGKPHGRLAFGYRRSFDPKTGETTGREPDPEQAAVVREMATRFLAGESITALCDDLDARGIASPHGGKGWSSSTIKKILTNPTTNGKRVDGDVVRAATWEAILDDETFARCVAKYADPSRRQVRQSTHARLLSGIARCGVCGGPMTYARSRTGTPRSPRFRDTYACRGSYHVSRGQQATDDYVTATVLERLGQPDALAELRDGDEETAFDEALVEIARLEAKIEDAYSAFMVDDPTARLSAQMLGRIEATAREEIATIRRRTRVSGLPSTVTALVESDDLDATWDSFTPEQKRETIRSLVTVVVLPVGKAARTFDPDSVVIEPKR